MTYASVVTTTNDDDDALYRKSSVPVKPPLQPRQHRNSPTPAPRAYHEVRLELCGSSTLADACALSYNRDNCNNHTTSASQFTSSKAATPVDQSNLIDSDNNATDGSFLALVRRTEEARVAERHRLLHDLRLLEAVPKHIALASLKDLVQDVGRLQRAQMGVDELGSLIADILGPSLGGEEGAALLAAHAEGAAAVSAYGEGMMTPEEVARLDDAVAVSATQQLYDDSDVINQHEDLSLGAPVLRPGLQQQQQSL